MELRNNGLKTIIPFCIIFQDMKKFKRVYVEIGNICNLSCPFCVQKHEKPRFLSLDKFEYILKQIRPYTSYIYLHVLGEPLMHPELEGILSLCQMYDLKVQITTNGTLLDEKLQLLKKYPVRQINVSVHSFPLHDKINQDDYLEKVLSCCDELSHKTYISYRLWCMNNYELNDEAKNLLNKILSHYQISYETCVENRNTLAQNRFLSFDEVFEWPSLEHEFISDTGTCRGLRDMIGILSNGDVIPCCLDAKAQAKLGNVFETSFNEIVLGSKAQQIKCGFLEKKLVHPLCKRCQYRTRFV